MQTAGIGTELSTFGTVRILYLPVVLLLLCSCGTANRAEISTAPTGLDGAKYDVSIWLTLHPFAINPHAMTTRDTLVATIDIKETENKNHYTLKDRPQLTILSQEPWEKVDLSYINIEIKDDYLRLSFEMAVEKSGVMVFNDDYKIAYKK